MHRFHVPGMKCGGCLGAVTRAIRSIDPAAHIEGNLDTREIDVSSEATESALLTTLSQAGYPAEPVQPNAQ
ncbi:MULTISPECIES: heavy-metal-associated domain-containing protein [Microvirga]|uniref:heavy-metal-associated domain-containing protein n=1 Tax=Microvirga TaxID=186650 RepID=UPI001CFFA1DA|nr:heavy-metal-associated domain-containing protein [Microvirga lenta]MCB5175823.1 heavy-metal-associated domain-containing protein [Microvirga lenta]